MLVAVEGVCHRVPCGMLYMHIVVRPVAVLILAGDRGWAALSPGMSLEQIESLLVEDARWA